MLIGGVNEKELIYNQIAQEKFFNEKFSKMNFSEKK